MCALECAALALAPRRAECFRRKKLTDDHLASVGTVPVVSSSVAFALGWWCALLDTAQTTGKQCLSTNRAIANICGL